MCSNIVKHVGQKGGARSFSHNKSFARIPQEITACMSLLGLLYHSREILELALFGNFLKQASWSRTRINISQQSKKNLCQTPEHSLNTTVVTLAGSLSDSHVALTDTCCNKNVRSQPMRVAYKRANE